MNNFFRFEKILNFIFPHNCVNCSKSGALVCPECLTKLHNSYQDDRQNTYSAFEYDNLIAKKLIWQLKYKGTKEASDILTPYLYDYLLEVIAEIKQFNYFEGKILVVPVPLHKTRKRKRGYNQAEVIAKTLVSLNPESFELNTGILLRRRNIKPQTKIKKREERLKNVIGAFAVKNPNMLQKRLVVVIDDVVTTGATLGECAKVLKTGGAGYILQAALASKE